MLKGKRAVFASVDLPFAATLAVEEDKPMTEHLFCAGFGYVAGYLAGDLLARGWRVSGTPGTGR